MGILIPDDMFVTRYAKVENPILVDPIRLTYMHFIVNRFLPHSSFSMFFYLIGASPYSLNVNLFCILSAISFMNKTKFLASAKVTDLC